MKTLILTLLLVPLLVLTARTQGLTTANEVLNAYKKALGGTKVLSQLKDITGEAVVGTDGYVTMKYKAPFKTFIISGSKSGPVYYKHTCDGQRIAIEMGTSKVSLTPAQTERGLYTYQIMPELYFAEKGVKSAFGGRETVEGKETYKLTHTTPGGLTWSANYNVQTGLKVQQVVHDPEGNAPEATRYSDYREVNGIRLPFVMANSGGATVKLNAYRVNTGISDAAFTLP